LNLHDFILKSKNSSKCVDNAIKRGYFTNQYLLIFDRISIARAWPKKLYQNPSQQRLSGNPF